MKCLVIETSHERTNAHPVTNEDGTPHIYATISEARAELKANGYSYNRANQRYYIKGTEYRAYIIREDSEEYAEATATAEEPEQTTAEIIAEQARDYYRDTICSAISPADIEKADAYTSDHLALTVEVMDALGIFHASDRMLVAIAQAMRWTLDDLEQQAIEQAHEDAARRFVSAYAEAIGDTITEDNPETVAAYQVAREAIGHATATEEQRATVAAMVEAIAQSTTEDAAEHLADAAELMETDADKLAQAAWSAAERGNATQAETIAASIAAMVDSAQRIADACNRIAAAAGSRYAADLAEKTRNSAAMVEQYAYNATEDAAEAEQRANDQTSRPYQRYELEAFLGEHLAEYDADAIEAEATEHDPKTGRAMWTPEAVRDLAAIAERHELKA